MNPLFIGIPKDTELNERRRLILVNIMTLICIMINLVYFIFLVSMGKYYISLLNLACGSIFGFLGIYFMMKRKYEIAKVFNLIVIPGVFLLFEMVYGDLGFNLYFVMFSISTFFVLENKKTILFINIWLLVVFVFMNVGLAQKIIVPYDEDTAYIGQMFYWSNLVMGFICNAILLAVFKTENLRYEVSLHEMNTKILQQNAEISTQRDEISTQRDFVLKQKTHIEEIHNNLTDSISYAERIQNAMLPDLSFLFHSKDEGESKGFILFKPRDIVSGDFYWVCQIKEKVLIAVADCTGHGVPGAFMSLLGISFLNDIVRKKEITQTNLVLEELRKHIIESLGQKGSVREQKDGMDIVICLINTSTNELQFSGANNPLYIIKAEAKAEAEKVESEQNLALASSLALIELLPDKQPVGIYGSMKPYTSQVIKLNKGDCIYLTSDGYKDQCGGPKYRKFMSKQLKELLAGISDKPMDIQKNLLIKTFEEWKGEYEQMDDVTILGIRI